jgi:UDP-N-acetyl-2-amino-2-deoxyglucuronate dehydrogenase
MSVGLLFGCRASPPARNFPTVGRGGSCGDAGAEMEAILVRQRDVTGLGGRAPVHGFGIAGAGGIAATHATAIAMLPGARLVAVADLRPESAQDFAATHGCAAEPSLAALLARADIDVVSVCVPSGLHAELGTQAARAGKHLVVEKPIDVTLAAADRLIGAARAAGVAVTVISQHRFDPGLAELRRLLDAGALGRLVLGEASTKWYRGQGYYDSAAWRGTWSLDGGSLMNQGIHYVDLLRWSMGPVTEVMAVCATRAHQVEVEDVALAVLRFSSGALGTIVASTAVFPGFAQRLEITGTEGTVVVEDGEIVHRAFRAAPAGPTAGTGQGDTGVAPPPAAADPAALDHASHAAQLADFLAAIDEGRRPAVTAEDGRDALEIVCAVYQSAREGRPVTLPAATGTLPGSVGPLPGSADSPPRSAGPPPARQAGPSRDAPR